MKKQERLDLIRRLINQEAIETQNELLVLLNQHGLELTQATVSRDMNEIGIIKVPSADGRYIYGISQEKTKHRDLKPKPIKASIISLSEPEPGLEHFLNLEVIPGTSRLLKKHFLQDFKADLFSVIADDDSLLLMAKTEEKARRLRQNIQAWMSEE